MTRLIAGLAVLVLAAVLAACGQESAALTAPSVAARWGPAVDLSGGIVYSATLTPTGVPSGVIALKSVQDGRVRTLDSYRFTGLEGPGAALVSVGRHAIEASWSLPGSGIWLKRGRTLLPSGSKVFATGYSGATIRQGELEGERVLWAQERYVGTPPSAGEMPIELAALVESSRQHPERMSYCLTLELGAP